MAEIVLATTGRHRSSDHGASRIHQSYRNTVNSQATLINAGKLLRVIYEHGARHATREEMDERHMGQRDWERAKALCIAAGVVDQVLQPLAGDYAAALKRVEEVHGAGVAELRKSKRGGLAWS